MSSDQTPEDDDNLDQHLPHPCPFPSKDVKAAKAWLTDPKSQDLSAWDHEKSCYAGKWHILEALIAEVVGINVKSLRKGIYAVCKEEWGDQPTIKRMGLDVQNNITQKYTEILRSQCKKEWKADITPWVASAIYTWTKRALRLWKKATLKNPVSKKQEWPALDQLSKERAESAGRRTPVFTQGDDIRMSTETATSMRHICDEYDDFVNYIVRNAEVHGNHNLQLQPTWLGYKKDPFDSTATKFRRIIKDRMIEDGILKQCNRGVQLDHSVSFNDYPNTGMCRWIQDYFSEGYGVTVRNAVRKILHHCQLKFHGPYVPPVYRPKASSIHSPTNNFNDASHVDLAILAPSDCGEYLDFINKIVRKALYFTYPQTVYEMDYPLSTDDLIHERAELLVGRVFRRMVKDNILEHTGLPMLGGYDLCPQFEAKRFYMKRRLPSSDAFFRLDTSNAESLLRLEKFLDADVDSISQQDLIRLYGSVAGSRYDELQAQFLSKVKCEVIEDDEPIPDLKINTAFASTSPAITKPQLLGSDGEFLPEKASPCLASYSESSRAASSFCASSASTLPFSEGPSYPSYEDMPSPLTDMDFSDDDSSESGPETEKGPEISTSKAPEFVSAFQRKLQELERKRKLESEPTKEEIQSPKRPHY
ncbi:hypothetical protein VTL71DRAFT_11525 [Oculimacula yallundae]|uniref:Uncharacterized protein n=1 Tax=Oculimacula yallundae TaxID=86028 RepID=A0ABR4CRI4_9HELO